MASVNKFWDKDIWRLKGVEGWRPSYELEEDDEFAVDAYLKQESRKSGFTDTLITGNKKKKSKLALPSLL